jgi:1,4-alpha-glucan branching enzyme
LYGGAVSSRGELAIVLHAHMPYVEGFGAGEERLQEAVARSYLPLVGVLERAPFTLSLSPVLCDQLEAAGPQGLLEALGAHATWTSAATHAILPLLASDALIAVQVQTGIASHRRRFGEWAGGFWLPGCAHAPWLDQPLEEAGVRATCVDLTRVYGIGDPRHLQPVATVDGPVLWPIDRAVMALAAGRPSEFVAGVAERVRSGGVCVCALEVERVDVQWLRDVIEEAARVGLRLTDLDDALERHQPAPAEMADFGVTSWGAGGDLGTWSGPAVADVAWQARTAELELLSIGRRPGDRALRELVALQSSDWAVLDGDYGRERARGHAEAVRRYVAEDAPAPGEPALRNLAPDLCGWVD